MFRRLVAGVAAPLGRGTAVAVASAPIGGALMAGAPAWLPLARPAAVAARFLHAHGGCLREGDQYCKNVDYSPDLTPADFDGPIDLDRPQVRTVGTPRVKALADDIVNLSLLDVNDLIEILTVRLNLPPPTGMPMGGLMGMGGLPPSPNLAGAADGGAAGAPTAEEKTEFDLKLEVFDKAAKIKVIKEIRVVTELGLKEAKELVEGAPCIIKKHLSKADAEAVIEKLKAVGADVVMV